MHGRRAVIGRMLVVPAEAGIQRLKSLDPGQKHAGMTSMWKHAGMTSKWKHAGMMRVWDSNGSAPFVFKTGDITR